MSKICIDVEFLAGTDITQAIEEAKQKARQWDVAYVKFSFNGCNFSIGQEANAERAVDRFRTNPETKYIIENG